jgi:hypothetical protein
LAQEGARGAAGGGVKRVCFHSHPPSFHAPRPAAHPRPDADGGRYYPAASCFGGASVRLNAGPHFAFPPPFMAASPADGRGGGSDGRATPTSGVTTPRSAGDIACVPSSADDADGPWAECTHEPYLPTHPVLPLSAAAAAGGALFASLGMGLGLGLGLGLPLGVLGPAGGGAGGGVGGGGGGRGGKRGRTAQGHFTHAAATTTTASLANIGKAAAVALGLVADSESGVHTRFSLIGTTTGAGINVTAAGGGGSGSVGGGGASGGAAVGGDIGSTAPFSLWQLPPRAAPGAPPAPSAFLVPGGLGGGVVGLVGLEMAAAARAAMEAASGVGRKRNRSGGRSGRTGAGGGKRTRA